VSLFFELFATVFTVAAMWNYSNRRVMWGALMGLTSQVGWWGVMIVGGLWGLIPINLIMAGIHMRAIWKEWKYYGPS
jgi:hypothetical protein